MKKDRRSFLTKLGLGITGALSMPLDGLAKITGLQNNPIKSIKPLGFQWETSDPFLFCAHHEDSFPKGNDELGPADSLKGRHMGNDFIIKDGYRMYHGKKVPGFPGHPHRGFETITIVRKGIVDHADSIGAAGRYGNGDVQWMTAGKGVQHSEMFPLLSKEKENPLELFQIWLNLPKKNKMVEPHFKMFWKEELPMYHYKDGKGLKTQIEIIAGTFKNVKAMDPPPDSWAADKNNHLAVWNILMDENSNIKLPAAAAGINRTLYFYLGENIRIEDKEVKAYHAIEVEANKEINIQNGGEKAGILLLQGKPIGETVMQYGPFVMNSKEEIQQAFEDYQKTKFGGWPWPKLDQVHASSEGRFAIHANGKKEVKGKI
jgi:redox-sensitive bicupin YhaK (pirin superfamily)